MIVRAGTHERLSERIERRDWLLIIGLCLTPMTGLRVWKIGPAEILCMLWSIFYFPKKKITANSIFKFFCVFMSAMLIGTLWGLYVSPQELSLDHWFTWIYLAFIAMGMYEGLTGNPLEYNIKLFDTFAMGAAIWYLFLFIYSRVISTSFLGAPLWYYGYRFTGGATNPHQIAVLMCGLTFYFTRYVFKRKKPIINSAFAIICAYLELQTAASTGGAALVVSFAITVFIITGHRVSRKRKRYAIYAMEIFAILIIGIIGYKFFYQAVYGWIASDKNGLGRLNLISQIGNSFTKSPVFGLGPGVHAFDLSGNIKEYHNTYLEILAATGIVGLWAFILLTIRTVKKILLVDDLLIPILVSIYVYGLGGFAMRRLAYWGLFVFIFVIAEQMGRKATGDKSSESTL